MTSWPSSAFKKLGTSDEGGPLLLKKKKKKRNTPGRGVH
jgi:hypothetical protein